MHKSLTLLLAFLCGCNASSQIDADRDPPSAMPPPAVDAHHGARSIFAVPRPNSGTFSTEEATALLPQFLSRSVPVSKTDTLATQWQSPTQGIRIHIIADDKLEIIDFSGNYLTGLDSIDGALDSTMTDGNERSVLLTSETGGWTSPTKQAAIDILFQPSVQIYLVGQSDEQPGDEHRPADSSPANGRSTSPAR